MNWRLVSFLPWNNIGGNVWDGLWFRIGNNLSLLPKSFITYLPVNFTWLISCDSVPIQAGPTVKQAKSEISVSFLAADWIFTRQTMFSFPIDLLCILSASPISSENKIRFVLIVDICWQIGNEDRRTKELTTTGKTLFSYGNIMRS